MLYRQGFGSGLILTGSGSMIFSRPDPDPDTLKIFHLFYDYFLFIFFINKYRTLSASFFCFGIWGLKPDPDSEKFENRIQAKTPHPDPLLYMDEQKDDVFRITYGKLFRRSLPV